MNNLKFYVLAAAVLALFSGQAAAKDACAHDNTGNHYRFKNIKSLKKPGQVSPINGYFINYDSSGSSSLVGSAYVKSDGKIVLGLQVFSIEIGGIFTLSVTGDSLTTGAGTYENIDSGLGKVAMELTSVDCKLEPLP